MNILMMGCSCAVPNYFGGKGVDKKYHTEYLLKELGHTIHNCAINGGTNFQTLERAQQYIQGVPIRHSALDEKISFDNSKIDAIIWFHSELFRDSIERSEEDLARETYARFAEFFKNFDAKIAVIGGAGDLHPCFFEYLQPDFCIPSWRRVIFEDPDLPLSNTVLMMHRIPEMHLSTKEKIDLIDKDNVIYKKLINSIHYPDHSHPGIAPHRNLVNKLQESFLVD